MFNFKPIPHNTYWKSIDIMNIDIEFPKPEYYFEEVCSLIEEELIAKSYLENENCDFEEDDFMSDEIYEKFDSISETPKDEILIIPPRDTNPLDSVFSKCISSELVQNEIQMDEEINFMF